MQGEGYSFLCRTVHLLGQEAEPKELTLLEQSIRSMKKIENESGEYCLPISTSVKEIKEQGYVYGHGTDSHKYYLNPDKFGDDFYIKLGKKYYHRSEGNFLYQLFVAVPSYTATIDSSTEVTFEGDLN